MLLLRTAHKSICASCRLHAIVQAQRLSRSRLSSQTARSIHYTPIRRYPRTRFSRVPERQSPSLDRLYEEASRDISREDVEDDDGHFPTTEEASSEERVLRARQQFGDELPDGLLTADEQNMFDVLYGNASKAGEALVEEDIEELEEVKAEDEGFDNIEALGTGVLRENRDGELEEIEYEDETPVYEKAPFIDHRRGRVDFAEDIEQALTFRAMNEEADAPTSDDDHVPRTHPLTEVNRFGTSPLSIALPRAKYIEPTALMLKASPNVHLSSATHRIFGGVGLPQSAATPSRLKTMQQKPIALEAGQSMMSPIEGDAYLAALIPALFACVTGVLVETRKRLGTVWGEEIVRKAAAGQLRILDAGAGGAGVMAVREVLRAEWERMHENSSPTTDLAGADGKIGGAGLDAPLGKATVLTGSPTLRKRMSALLDDTSFVPRLPNYAKTETAKLSGKYDIIIAPHTIWPLREDYLRKAHVQNLWSLLSNDGGVLLLMEKGTPRGFELIAGAREMLLDNHIASPGSENRIARVDEASEIEWEGEQATGNASSERPKDVGMIIAPCTNHTACPMYVPKGKVKGRKDVCSFEQRYVRPRYLQTILGAKEKNWEDVEYSYLSVMRGRDLRQEATSNVEQGLESTERAFRGYQEVAMLPGDDSAVPHSLSLPRLVLPPLKRQGHVIMDVCTPSGTLERWTVPKSFGKQAYRDARKSTWGDLWALGAKFRHPRVTHISKHARREAENNNAVEAQKEVNQKHQHKKYAGIDTDEHGRLVFGEQDIPLEGGKVRSRKIKGIREKRDKKGTGNGRRKSKDYD